MMAPLYIELSGGSQMSTCILDCLLPNSIIVPLTCHKDIILSKLKNDIWQEAKKYPLYRVLRVPEEYVLVGVTQDAEQEEFWDESRRLCDLRLFSPILKIMAPRGSKEEKVLNHEISYTASEKSPLAKLYHRQLTKEYSLVKELLASKESICPCY